MAYLPIVLLPLGEPGGKPAPGANDLVRHLVEMLEDYNRSGSVSRYGSAPERQRVRLRVKLRLWATPDTKGPVRRDGVGMPKGTEYDVLMKIAGWLFVLQPDQAEWGWVPDDSKWVEAI